MKQPFRRSRLPIGTQLVSIAGDAGIVTPNLLDGKLVPILILDCRTRPDLVEAVRNHVCFATGDVRTTWAQLRGSQNVVLILEFVRPTEVTAVVEFELPLRALSVEHILHAKALYIQAGRPGDRIIHNLGLPKILVEVVDTGFGEKWDKIFQSAVAGDFKAKGIDRAQAKSMAKEFVAEIKQLARFRMLA